MPYPDGWFTPLCWFVPVPIREGSKTHKAEFLKLSRLGFLPVEFHYTDILPIQSLKISTSSP